MTKYGIRLACLLIALALGALPPQFAQEAPKDADQQSPLHSLMGGFIRTVNTAEVKRATANVARTGRGRTSSQTSSSI